MDDLIKRADEALKDVTPGPWADWKNKRKIGVDCERADIAHCSGFDSSRSSKTERANARFIAAARELVPAMRDRIEADAKRIAELALNAHGALTQADEAYQAQLKAEARIAELEAALRALLRFVEKTESEMGIVLGSADLARAALGEKKDE